MKSHDGKPLYINSRHPVNVVMDGPAMLVKGAGRDRGRFPLRRISRIVICGPVNLRHDVLAVCLKRGITVSVIATDGTLLGHCLDAHLRPVRLAAQIYDLLDRPDWEDVYTVWRTARTRRAMLSLPGVLNAPVPICKGRSVEYLTNRFARTSSAAHVDRIMRFLEGLMAALVMQHLSSIRLAQHLRDFTQRGMNLCEDLTAVLVWEVWPVVLARVPTLLDRWRTHDRERIIREFEKQAAKFDLKVGAHLDSLSRRIVELY